MVKILCFIFYIFSLLVLTSCSFYIESDSSEIGDGFSKDREDFNDIVIDNLEDAVYIDASGSDIEDAGCELKVLNNVIKISNKWGSKCVLMSNGGVKCWGENYYGEIGDGTKEDRPNPVDVAGLTSGVKDISTGHFHACAVLENGRVKCWGNNEDGQIGDGTTENRLTPVDVIGISSGVKEVSAGYYYTCALMVSGGVMCWGNNEGGQLGDGTFKNNRLTPAGVIGLNSNVQKITTGSFHTCALMTNGTVKCWGYNDYGQLGDGTKENRSTPVDVYGLPTKVKDISGGGDHTCALLIDGRVMCWGRNDHCQLGNGSTEESQKPVFVLDLDNDVLQVDAGDEHTCGLLVDGKVMCWGNNWCGQFGDGTCLQKHYVASQTYFDNIKQISAGSSKTCALTNDGYVECAGSCPGQYGTVYCGVYPEPVKVCE